MSDGVPVEVVAASLITAALVIFLEHLIRWFSATPSPPPPPSTGLWQPTGDRGFLRKRGFLSARYKPEGDGRLLDPEALIQRLPLLLSGPHDVLR